MIGTRLTSDVEVELVLYGLTARRISLAVLLIRYKVCHVVLTLVELLTRCTQRRR